MDQYIMYAPCSSVLASTIANIPQSHLHFKVSLLIWSLNKKEDNSLFVSHTHSDTHTVDNRVRQREYGSLQVTRGSIFSNCVCHTAT